MSKIVARKSKTLSEKIKVAIAKQDIEALYELKDICDRIHETGESYKNYTPKDLPSDALYEEMVRTINAAAAEMTDEITADDAATYTKTKRHKEKLIPDLWMGSITKETEILEIENALMLPKFDGCSCGVKLKRYIANSEFELVQAITRGTMEGYDTKRSDITEKFAMLADPFVKALSSPQASMYRFDDKIRPDKNFGNVLQITLRGELVLKDKSKCDSAPASVVAGKINGHMAVWQDGINMIEFVPYEIIRFRYDLTDSYNYYIPTQMETITFFDKLGLIHFPVDMCDLNADELETVQEHFKYLNEAIPQPLDGVVYCSKDWRYPAFSAQTTPKQYGKYAWKPSSEATSTLKSITYSLARDGKFTFILSYDPIKINGKRYLNAKTATSRMVQLHGMGIGSVITVKLAGDISPMITDFINEDDEVEVYELPDKCPFCGKKTVLKKGKTPTLSCTNQACPEITKQKYIYFFKNLSIKGIAEGKLSKLKDLRFKTVVDTYFELKFISSKLLKTDTRSFMVAIGLGGIQAVSKKLKDNTSMNPLATVKVNFQDIKAYLSHEMKGDPFVADVLGFIETLL